MSDRVSIGPPSYWGIAGDARIVVSPSLEWLEYRQPMRVITTRWRWLRRRADRRERAATSYPFGPYPARIRGE